MEMSGLSVGERLDGIYELDQSRINGIDLEKDKDNLDEVEKMLFESLDELLEYGTDKNFFTIFLVIQHSNITKQKQYFSLLESFVEKGKLEKRQIALLEDRILVGEGKKQRYGSQVWRKDLESDWTLSPIEDIQNVDVRRKSVGLETLREYLLNFGDDIVYSEEQSKFLELS